MKKFITLGCLAAIAAGAAAETFTADRFDYYGPYRLAAPLMVDSVDVNGNKFADANLSAAPAKMALHASSSTPYSGTTAPGCDSPAVHVLAFDFENAAYAAPTVEVKGIKDFALYLDGKKVDGNKLALRPATHNLAIRYVTAGENPSDSLKVSLKADNDARFSLRTDGKRRYTLEDVLHGTRVASAAISPDGKYIIAGYSTTVRGGSSSRVYKVTSVADGKTVAERGEYLQWMPKGSRYYYERPAIEGREIVAVDAATGAESVIASSIPDDVSVVVTPDEKSLILYSWQQGKKEDAAVYQVLEPEDRQPGWRSRTALSILDIATGITRPLTFGNRSVSLLDISDDSKKLLISTSKSRLERRPTTIFSLYALDIATMKADTLVSGDGFIGQAIFSPDAGKVIVSGTPQALGEIGKNVPEGRIPSMVDNQLFIIDVATKKAAPLTRDFNPSVGSFEWNRADGQVYFTAEDRDKVGIFRLNPANGSIQSVPVPEDVVGSISLPKTGRTMTFIGESASSPNALYALDTKSLRSSLIASPKRDMLADVKLGTCEGWDFVNSRGDTINGRFYLPPDFDPAKKYPLIVNYYGGCSPTSRNFESRYPHNAYAAQGYVVYVINPSGATGFGQEFSSRHVNTAGEGVAQDIIEGTKKFCQEHPFVNDKKIGCIGASYGGFMTQYLQTVTDIFAAAISHAGISDHTSYWGEGYWGYSYSEVSMAESYPWSNPDLYVKQSPLYNADKVHTPLLFLHGDKDNNVPVGESIQMFTALKLLNRPTAFVAVADQDHHIIDYDKRIKWQDTIFAWFDRYLKDDPTWWEALYPTTPL